MLCFDRAQAALHPFPLLASPPLQAVYQQLDPVRVKGRQLPVDIYEVTSLHAEALAAGQRPGLSPLLPTPLQRGLPPVAEAAAAVAAARLSRQGSAAGPAAVPPPAEGSLEALAAGLAPGGRACCTEGPQQAQQAQQDDSGAMLSMSDRLLSIASTAAAPVGLLPHTPMIGARVPIHAASTWLCIMPATASLAMRTPAQLTHAPDSSRPLFFHPCAGRDGELAAITMRCVDLVRHKRGGLVLVEGDAGMGKTRLVEELQHRWAAGFLL